MQYLIDSDWFIDYLESIPAAVALIAPLAQGGLGISVVTDIEVYPWCLQKPNRLLAEQRLEPFIGAAPERPFFIPVAQRRASAGVASEQGTPDGQSRAVPNHRRYSNRA